MDAMTRIIAGLAQGTSLKVPASGTRPTSERVREAVFGALEARDEIADARVLDLFAGSGALGLEAASRGAANVTMVELSRRAAQVAKDNAQAIARKGTCGASVVVGSAQRFLADSGAEFDLILIDPPYDLPADELAATLALTAPRLADHGVVVLEQAKRAGTPRLPAELEVVRERAYGDTVVFTIEAASETVTAE